jgi:general secretion pathway protein L
MSLRNPAAAFLLWMDCVVMTIGRGVESLRRLPRLRLIEGEADVFRLEIPSGANCSYADVDSVRIDNGRLIGRDCEQIAAALRGSRTELILRLDRFLVRPLDLPKQAGEFLDGIIRSQIDRLTPWSADEAAFGWSRPVEIENDRIAFYVVATSRSLILSYVDVLKEFRAASIVVSAVPSAAQPGAGPIEIFEQRGVTAIDSGKLRRSLIALLVVAGLSCACAILADRIAGANLVAQKSDVLRRMTVMRRDGSGEAPARQFELERQKTERPASVVVLEALSKILPDHTYLTELRIEGDRIQAIGITQDAPSLIQLLEQSRHFARATFYAPTTRSPGDRGDHFHIEARIKPGSAVQ